MREKDNLLQHVPRIDHAAVLAHLEVQVRAGGVTGRSAVADYLPLGHALAAGDRETA